MLVYTALRFRGAQRIVPPLLAMIVLLTGQVTPAPAQAPKALSPVVNLQHALLVRKALTQEKELAKLNIGVVVENRVATLWGAAPSAKVITRAILVAKSVPDIVEVRSNLYVDPTEAEVPKYLPEPNNVGGASATVLPPALTKPASQTDMPGVGQTTSITKGTGNWQPAAQEKSVTFKPEVVPGPTEDQALFVLPPIAIPSAPGETSEVPLAVTLKDRVLQLQAADLRYQKLKIQVDGKRVYIDGAVAQYADVQKLAKAIAQLPGVESVIIGQVQVTAAK